MLCRRVLACLLLTLALDLPAGARAAEMSDHLGRWRYSQRGDAASGGVIATAELPGESPGTKLILQCIPSAESKDLFLAVGAEATMDFRTQGGGTLEIDHDKPIETRWAFLEKLMILNQTEPASFNADVMRRMATARTLKVSTPAADGSTFSAYFMLDRVADVVTRLFGACAVQ